MSETRFFSIEEFEGGAFVTPLETVRSFSDEEVRGEWDDVLVILDDSSSHKIAVDLGRLSFFGSAMLEWIVLLGRHVRSKGGDMVLCNPEAATLDVLKIARFDTLYPIVETRDEALAKLGVE